MKKRVPLLVLVIAGLLALSGCQVDGVTIIDGGWETVETYGFIMLLPVIALILLGVFGVGFVLFLVLYLIKRTEGFKKLFIISIIGGILAFIMLIASGIIIVS